MSDEKKKSVKPNPRAQQARRRFLRSIGLGAGAVGVSMLGFIPVITQSSPRLRPPGAIAEQEYLASCIKCGQCIKRCPVDAITLESGHDKQG